MQMLEVTNATNIAKKQLSDLSGGELQKVFLARALVQKPNLLLLDEPTTGLDTASEIDIQSYIKSLNMSDETAVIMVTHNIDVAKKYANKLLLLNKEMIYFGDTAAGLEDEYLKKVFVY
jgi:ABC-type Mn2+/Zn2+ transport system ATPase subunit